MISKTALSVITGSVLVMAAVVLVQKYSEPAKSPEQVKTPEQVQADWKAKVKAFQEKGTYQCTETIFKYENEALNNGTTYKNSNTSLFWNPETQYMRVHSDYNAMSATLKKKNGEHVYKYSDNKSVTLKVSDDTIYIHHTTTYNDSARVVSITCK